MSNNILMNDSETPKEYRIRLYKNKDLYGLSNIEIGDLCNKAFGVNYDESAHRKKVKNYLQGYEDAKLEYQNNLDNDLYLNQIKNERLELQKERYKLQSEKIDYNRAIREESRDSLIAEKIISAVKELNYNENPKIELKLIQEPKKEYILFLGDQHYGCEFKIKGFHGEVLNEYSPEIFEERMEYLFSKIVNIIKKEGIGLLHIYDLGDSIDGCLRVSQLWKLRYGVIDSTIHYANFMSNWLNELTSYVDIEYQMVIDANHSQLRMLGQPKNTFKEDNLSKVIGWFIKEKLSNNSRFVFTQNDTGFVYSNLCGFNLLGIHGDMKDYKNLISNFSMNYKIDVNYLVSGHFHHNKSEEIGVNYETIGIGSIMGADDYAFSLHKTSLPSVKLMCIEEGIGKTLEYTIPLKYN